MDIKDLENLNLYQILGVNYTATDQEIKKSYRKLVRQYHPDARAHLDLTNEQREEYEEILRSIKNAYEILKDPEKREEYDNNYIGRGSNTLKWSEHERRKKSKISAPKSVYSNWKKQQSIYEMMSSENENKMNSLIILSSMIAILLSSILFGVWLFYG